MKTLTVFLLMIATASAEVRLIGRPDLAVQLALTDLEKNPHLVGNVFYIFVRDSKDKDLIAVYDWVLNTAVSRSNSIQRTTKIDGAVAGCLLRMEIDQWLPTDDARTNFVQCFARHVDPSFYTSAGTVKREFQEAPAFESDGQSFTAITLQAEDIQSHVPGMELLQEATGLTVPIVEAEHFLVHSLRSLGGGLYYRLQGIDSFVGTERVRQTLTQWLATFGASEDESESLGGEEFVGLFRSDVTGKPRRAKAIFGRSSRPSAGIPLIVITQDSSDDQLDEDQHPMYSLLDFEFSALESIAVKPNGMLSYALHAADGTLQDSAPDNVVHDHLVPPPNTSRLEGAISCIRCHGPQGQWKPLRNDVKSLLSRQGGIQLLAIADDGKDARERITSLYSGDLGSALQLARDAFERATIASTGLTLEGDGYAVRAAEIVSERFGAFLYDPVDATEALRTLGIVADPAESVQVLRELLPELDALDFDPVARTLQTESDGGKTTEVIRSDWERIFPACLQIAIETGTVAIDEKPNRNAAANPRIDPADFIGPIPQLPQ